MHNAHTSLHSVPPPARLCALLAAYAAIDESMAAKDPSQRIYHAKATGENTTLYTIQDNWQHTFHVLQSGGGTLVKGFDAGCDTSPYAFSKSAYPKAWDFFAGVPARLLQNKALPAVPATFCIWQGAGEDMWHAGGPPLPANAHDGISMFLYYAQTPEEYALWFSDYWECPLPAPIFKALQHGKPLTPTLLQTLGNT